MAIDGSSEYVTIEDCIAAVYPLRFEHRRLLFSSIMPEKGDGVEDLVVDVALCAQSLDMSLQHSWEGGRELFDGDDKIMQKLCRVVIQRDSN